MKYSFGMKRLLLIFALCFLLAACGPPQDGHGTHEFDNGTKYVGEYKGGKAHGQGTATFADGGKYVGEWKDGKYHGRGTYTLASGDKYVGEFKNQKRHGQGTYRWADGTKYVGKWKDDKQWKGTGYDKDGNVIATISEGVKKFVK